MSHPVDPEILRLARIVALSFARRVRLDRDDCVGVAYLKVAEMAAKRELTVQDANIVGLAVRRAIIDWQRMESPLTRDEIRARSPVPVHVDLDAIELAGPRLPLGDPWLRRAVMRLEGRLRDAVIACCFLDTSHVEYARQIGRTDAMVSFMLKEAREQLRQFLADDFTK